MSQPIQNPKSKIQNLVVLLLLYIAVALAHTYLAPLTTGPDELAHYEYTDFIAEHGRLPLDYTERGQAGYKSDQPPLYHLITALPALLVDTGGPSLLKRVSDHPRRQLIERTRHAWGLYNTEDELWPYRGEVLRWHVGRWIAIFFGAATVVITFFMAGEVFDPPKSLLQGETFKALSPNKGELEGGQSRLVALGAAAIVAFIPRFALTGSMLNYDTTLAFFAALFLWVLLRLANSQSKIQNPKSKVLLGFFAGLAITAKLSALIFPVEIVIAFWLIGRHYSWDCKIWAQRVLITGAATLVAVSWWFGFVIYQFNTVAQDGWWVGLLRPLIAADASDATTNRLLSFLTGGEAGFTGAIENLDSGPPWEWAAIFFRTFWSVGIEQQQPLGWFGLLTALGLCLVAAYGLVGVWQGTRGQGAADGAGGVVGGVPPLSPRPTPGMRFIERGFIGVNTSRRLTTRDENGGSYPPSPPACGAIYRGDKRLILSLLLLHVLMAFVLPLIRYATTFSLADTAQGRHILFQTAPAFAVLLVWGVSATGYHVSRITHHASRFTFYVLRLIPLIPGLFLLFWTGVQLWTMTWAYNPLLPVSVLATARTQVNHPLNQPLNKFVTLLGYNSRLDHQNQVLRVDLLWQATTVSPVDYLTEVSLLDSEGTLQAQWLGYPAGGRYPTRAWDAGDIVRDTVWLPAGGLEPGQYTLTLNLLAATLKPVPYLPALESPLTLGSITLADSTLPVFSGNLPFTGTAMAAAGYSVWQNGEPLTQPRSFRYRETVLVTFSPLLPGQERTARMIGPDQQSFTPVRQSETTVLFIVGPDWPTGDYHLQVTLTDTEQGERQVETDTLARVIDRWGREFAEPPMSHRLEANFADQVKLLGYDLGANRVEPGGGIPVTLYWQGLDWMGDDYTIFTKLLAADGTVHGGRDRLPREGYSTLYWAPGEVISDPFGVPVNIDAPDGIYYLNLGLYKQVDQQAVSLPLAQDGQPIDATSVNIGPIKVGDTPPNFTLDQADPQIVVNQPFGNPPALTLLGYDLADETGQPIINYQLSIINYQSLKLTLYWQSETILPLNYTTFVHLRNAAGETVAQKDQPPLDGAYPTSLWDPGEIIADEIIISLPAELPAGEYQLVIGLYDLQTSQRLTVPGYLTNEVMLVDF